jgi:hypothetical protein
MEVVAIDWSGAAKGAAAHIWLAHVVDGELISLRNGRSRQEVVDALVDLRASTPVGLVVGLDFSFSFPAWFLRAQSCNTVEDLWETAEREGERWLAECASPFWGRPGRRRPVLPTHLRRAEQVISVGGISPKSSFQIGGAGAVGTGSIRGMPHLRQLRAAGFSIWPFDPPSPFTVLEIYPRQFTGPVHKSNRACRIAYLARAPWVIAPPFVASMAESEDAFDAGISALAMHDHVAHPALLQQSTDPITLLEGDVWRPPKIIAMSEPQDSPNGSRSSDGPQTSEGPAPSTSKNHASDDRRPNLTTQVRRRRADEQFFLRLRDAIQQNHRALERLGT